MTNFLNCKTLFLRSAFYFFISISLLSAICYSPLFSQPIQQHVILVVIDGARYSETLGDPTGQYIPRMKALITQAAIVDTCLNDSLTYTSRAIPAIWCGSWVSPRDTIINGESTQYCRVPTVWEYFRKDRQLDSTQAMYILKQLSGPWLPSYHAQYGPAYWPWYIMQYGYWSDLYVWTLAKSKLQAHHPKFALIYLADVDAAGHSGDWNNYTRKITIADSIVGMLWDFIQSDPIYKNKTTLLITNDHGRHLDGVSTGFVSHGCGCWGCRRIMFMGIGSGIKPGISPIKRKMIDITPTIGAMLNFTTPFSSGNRITEILKPIVSFSRKSIAFGSVPAFSPKIDSFVVYNSGGAVLNISSVVSSNPVFTISPVSTQINPHSSKSIRVSFTPPDTGYFSADVIVTHDDTNQTDTIKVNGIGTPQLISINLAVSGNWNLVSVPVLVNNWHYQHLFPNSISPAFAYSGTYVIRDSLQKGLGYWLKFQAPENVNLTGVAIKNDTIDVAVGWNLIGSISLSIPVSTIMTTPANIIASSVYGYRAGYVVVDTLKAGYGYWIKTNSAGKIILKD